MMKLQPKQQVENFLAEDVLADIDRFTNNVFLNIGLTEREESASLQGRACLECSDCVNCPLLM